MGVTWKKALSVWWSFLWRTAVYGVLLTLIIGLAAGYATESLGDLDQGMAYGMAYGTVVGVVASVPASVLALKHALSRHLGALSAASASTIGFSALS